MVDLGRGYMAYRFYECVVKKPTEFLDTNHGRYWKWDKDHFQTVNDTYGRHYRCQKLENNSSCDLDDRTPGYLKKFDRMTGRKPHTPWSTSNAEYGKHIDVGRQSSLANYKFVPANDANAVTNAIEPSIVSEVKDKDENQIATPKPGSSENAPQKTPCKGTPNLSGETGKETRRTTSNSVKSPEADIGTSELSLKTEKMVSEEALAPPEVAIRPVGEVRRSLPSRGPARRFMQEQCCRLLDNIQAVRGIKDTPQGRVQVLTLDDTPAEEEHAHEQDSTEGQEPEVSESAPFSSASSRSHKE